MTRQVLKKYLLGAVGTVVTVTMILVLSSYLSSGPVQNKAMTAFLPAVQHVYGKKEMHLYHSGSQLQNKATTTSQPVVQRASSHNICQPVTHFIMTKIEKTGSSTLFTIFARFVLEHRLNNIFVSNGSDRYHIDWYDDSGKNWTIGPRSGQPADVLIDHAKYNKSAFEKHFVKDFTYIVPVREPESWLQSALNYFKRESGISMSAEALVMNNSAFHKPRDKKNLMRLGSWFHLVQLQWLGFDYSQKNNLTAIKEYIDYIVPKIDIPIPLEQFDASLIILRRRFCWGYTDIFYTKKTVSSKSNRTPLSRNARQNLFSLKGNLGEKLLYDKMNESWWSQPEVVEEDFWHEVAYFQKLNHNVSHVWCSKVMKSKVSQVVPANHWHDYFSITPKLCDYLPKLKPWFALKLFNYTKGQH